MRILHVISGLDPRQGGVATSLVGLSTAQAEAGLNTYIVTSITAQDDPETIAALRKRGVAIATIGPVQGKLGRCPGMTDSLQKLIAAADIVHIHGLWEQILHEAAVLSHLADKPYVMAPHGMLDPWSLRQSKWKKRLYMAWRLRKNLVSASAIHFTAAIERDLTTPLQLRLRTIVEPNGIDMNDFDILPPAGSFRALHPIAVNRPLVLFMGRLHPKKGFDLLIPAFARLKNRDAVLAIVGPEGAPGYRGVIESMIARAGIQDRVFFTGMLYGQQKVAALADADLFVLPSYQENFGNVVIESLAAGTPVAISDQVNLYPEILEGNVGGVTPTDVGKISAEIDRWLGDEQLLRKTGVKARAFAANRFDWRKIAGRWNNHYAAISGVPAA